MLPTTDEHPFFVTTGERPGWTRTDRLSVGDTLATFSGSDAVVIAVEFTAKRATVYNLSIPGSPTYFVGEHGVWVHNCDIDANKLTHIFGNPGHKLDGLVASAGGQAEALEAIQVAAERVLDASGSPLGVFETSIHVLGHVVTVRGNKLSTGVRIGTAFVP